MYFDRGVIEFQMLGGVSQWFHSLLVIKIVGDTDLALCTDHLRCFMLYFYTLVVTEILARHKGVCPLKGPKTWSLSPFRQLSHIQLNFCDRIERCFRRMDIYFHGDVDFLLVQ